MASWREQPGPARAIGMAATRAVESATGKDIDGYREAVDALVALPTVPVGQVLGAVLRSVVEERYPDGLDDQDLQELLTGCQQSAVGWLPPDRIDLATLVAAIASALGIHVPGITYEDAGAALDWSTVDFVPTPPTPAEYAWHAPLLIAELLAGDRRALARHLDATFAEIARAETIELP